MNAIEKQLLENQKNIISELGILKGILVGSNGGGHEGRIKSLEKNQKRYITINGVMMFVAGVTLITKLAGLW